MDKEKAGIWITGASSGIGKATVNEFVSVGCNVFASARRVNELNRLSENNDESQITSFKSAEENSIKEIDEVINTNLLGSIYTTKAVLPHFKKIGGGTIINVLSIVTEKTFTNSSVYTASKMGLLGYSRVLREEVRKYNIRVINVLPGATETPIWTREMREENSERMMNPESIARLIVSTFLQSDNLVAEEIIIRPLQGDL